MKFLVIMPFIKMLVACLFIYSDKVDYYKQHRCLIIDGIGTKNTKA